MAAPPLAKPKDQGLFVVPEGKFQPPKIVVPAVEGFGKTTIGSTPKGTVMLATETGYKTLLGVNKVPAIPFLVTDNWKDTMEALDNLGDAKYLTIDEGSGFEQQCFDYECRNKYDGNWMKFWNFHKGASSAQNEWSKFLVKLESLNIPIIMLSHCTIETFKDPTSEDYSRYVAAMHKLTWQSTRRWADACLFGSFRSIVDDGKGIGGTDRVLYTEHRDTHDAKNRYGMDDEIVMPDDPSEMWNTIWSQIKP